jgi:hypothetical protein
MDRARQEHKDLVDTLKKCDVRTIELDGAEEYPECPFVDDCVYNPIIEDIAYKLYCYTNLIEIWLSELYWLSLKPKAKY